MAKEMRKRSPLYDSKGSQTRDAADESRGEERSMAKEAVSKAKESEGAKMADKAKDAEKEMGESQGMDKVLEGLRQMHKSHEAERRDFHGNMRDQMRQMASRHEKQLRDLMMQHTAEAGAAPAEGAPAGGGGEE